MIVIQIQNQSTKEEMINITIKNLNFELKITSLTKGKEEIILVSLMNVAKCRMKAIEWLKINHLETHLISKERIKTDQEIMMIDTEILTISKVSWMPQIKKITMIAQTIRKTLK